MNRRNKKKLMKVSAPNHDDGVSKMKAVGFKIESVSGNIALSSALIAASMNMEAMKKASLLRSWRNNVQALIGTYPTHANQIMDFEHRMLGIKKVKPDQTKGPKNKGIKGTSLNAIGIKDKLESQGNGERVVVSSSPPVKLKVSSAEEDGCGGCTRHMTGQVIATFRGTRSPVEMRELMTKLQYKEDNTQIAVLKSLGSVIGIELRGEGIDAIASNFWTDLSK